MSAKIVAKIVAKILAKILAKEKSTCGEKYYDPPLFKCTPSNHYSESRLGCCDVGLAEHVLVLVFVILEGQVVEKKLDP